MVVSLVHTSLGSSCLIAHMSSTILLPPRAQLCIRYCSNKQQQVIRAGLKGLWARNTRRWLGLHQPPWSFGFDSQTRVMVGIRSPDGLVVGSCTSHPGVLGSIPKREEPGKTGRHPVLKYRVPHGYQCVMGRLVHTGLGSSSLVAHVLNCPPPPSRTAL